MYYRIEMGLSSRLMKYNNGVFHLEVVIGRKWEKITAPPPQRWLIAGNKPTKNSRGPLPARSTSLTPKTSLQTTVDQQRGGCRIRCTQRHLILPPAPQLKFKITIGVRPFLPGNREGPFVFSCAISRRGLASIPSVR